MRIRLRLRALRRMSKIGAASSARGCAVLLVAMLIVGCAGEPEAEPGEAVPFRIALVMKSLANEFFVTMAEGARQHQQRNAGEYELVVNGTKNESDLTQQVALVEQMISISVDAIVLAPTDSKALVPVVHRAQAAGITVINIDNKLDAEVLAEVGIEVPFVGPDNRLGARAVGQRLAEELEAGDKVAIIGGIPTAFNAQERQAGFEEAMADRGVEIVEIQSGGWEQALANTVAGAIISEHPDLAALLCSNDNMALGAAAAIRQAGRAKAGGAGGIWLVGFDNIAAIREMVADGTVLATADQHADQLAVFGIEAALGILRGESSPADRQTPVDLVTAASLAP